MEGCTTPVAWPFLCKWSHTTGVTKQARSCSICGRAFPHPPHMGLVPPHLGAQVREPEQRTKGMPSLPLTLAPNDLECRAPHHPFCYVLVEHSARHELDGYDSIVWHIVLEACASDTRWGLMVCGRMGGTGLRGHGRCPRCMRCSGGICMFHTSRLDWYENSDLRSKSTTGTV